jgi:tetratricopeptide (TPR) repeat protein
MTSTRHSTPTLPLASGPPGSPRAGVTWLTLLAVTAAVATLPALVLAQNADTSESFALARTALRTGEYADAIRAYRDVLDDLPGSATARVGLIEALLATGQYEDAVEVGTAAPDRTAVANATGEALLRVGRLDEAAQAFRASASGGGVWALTAEVNLAELYFDRGDVDEAMRRFDRFIDIYNTADGQLGSRDLVAVGRAVRYLGRTNSELFQDALKAFDEASMADPTWAEPAVRAGALFLEKYDSPNAKTEFEKALAQNPNHPGALLGLAESLIFDGASDSQSVLDRLFEVDENHVEAKALVAMRMLTNEAHESASELAEEALAVNPRSLPALTALAGSHLQAGELVAFAEVRDRVHRLNPHYARFDVALADLSVKTRRYAQAVERAEAAVALDSAAWEAWGILGMNQLRLGDIEVGRANLERAFGGDPYNPWFKNNLDLLDTFDRFETRTTEHFELFLHGTEADLLGNYLAPIAEEAFDSLSRRYGIEPSLPVRAELFPSHADFSVRTLGEAGLGALGVSFGRVLVMDSPSARELGDYNWASVFWHELSHTFHLAMSDNRVPRWFSEGLAVHEQRKAREGWGHQATIPFLQALRDGDLKRFSELNDGFMRPAFPQQVIFSYYEASLVFELIENEYGFAAIRRMLDGYRDGRTTEELMQTVLGTSIDDFDDDFDDYLRARFRSPLAGLVSVEDPPGAAANIETMKTFTRAHPGDLIGRLRLGIMLFRDGRHDEAQSELEAALSIFPDNGNADSPYWFLAAIHRERGDLEQAEAALAQLGALSEANYNALLEHADVLEELGREGDSAAALDRAVLIWPYDATLHIKLAELHTELGDYERAVLERRAVVALDPVDRAEALYLLARSQHDLGATQDARRSVMRALEIAPNYEDALELLLELRGTRP